MDAEDTMLVIFAIVFMAFPISIILCRVVRSYQNNNKKNNSLGKGKDRYRARIDAYLFHTTNIGLYLDLFQVALSLFACGCYVYETYVPTLNIAWWQTMELVVGSMFGADYILRFYLAKDKLVYFFEPMPLIDFLTVVPTFIYAILLFSGGSTLSFLRVLRLLRALRVLRVLKIMRLFTGNRVGQSPTVWRLLVRVLFTALCIIFSCGCFFALVEGIPFHVAFFFMCSMALGRPPIPVMTGYGFLLVYTLVLLSNILLPKQLADLVAVWAASKGKGEVFKKKPEEIHVFVSSDARVSALRDFLQDLFRNWLHSSTMTQPVKVSLMVPFGSLEALESLLVEPPFAEGVTCVAGSDLDRSDLVRAQAASSARIFLFSTNSSSSTNWEWEEHSSLARVMALRKHCPGVPICIQVITPETKARILSLPQWDPAVDVCICTEALKCALMSINCLVAGSSTLLTNLLASSSADQTEADHLLRSRAALQAPWASEYHYGRESSICTLKLPPALHGVPFHKAALHLYREYGCCILAKETAIPTVPGGLGALLYPREHIVEPGDTVFAILPPELWSPLHMASTQGLDSEAISAEVIANAIETENRPIQPSTPGGTPAEPVGHTLSLCREGGGSLPQLTTQHMERHAKLTELWEEEYEHDSEALLEDVYRTYGHHVRAHLAPLGQLSPLPVDKGGQRAGGGGACVLICGYNPNLVYTVQGLIAEGMWVSILALRGGPVEDGEAWAAMSRGTVPGQVAFTKGCPMKLEELMRAGLLKATCVLILSNKREVEGVAPEDEMHDTDALISHNLVRRNVPNVFVTTELLDSETVKYIHHDMIPGALELDGSHIQKYLPYATGQIFSSLIFNLFMSNVQRRLGVLALLHQLSFGTEEVANDGSYHTVRSIKHLMIPSQFVGKPYAHIFQHMVEYETAIPIGLFGCRGNSEPVVLTNPKPDTIVNADDKMYVIAASLVR